MKISDLKKMWKLSKMSLKFKTTFVVLMILTVCGLGISLLFSLASDMDYWSSSAYPSGEMLMMIGGLFFVQAMFSYGMCSLAMTSPLKRKMQITWVTQFGIVWMAIVYAFSILIRLLPLRKFPEEEAMIGFPLVVLAVLTMFCWIYSMIVYRFYAVSMVLFFVLWFGAVFFSSNYGRFAGIRRFAESLTFGACVGIGAGIILLTSVIGYVLSLFLYQFPVSKYVFRRYMKK